MAGADPHRMVLWADIAHLIARARAIAFEGADGNWMDDPLHAVHHQLFELQGAMEKLQAGDPYMADDDGED